MAEWLSGFRRREPARGGFPGLIGMSVLFFVIGVLLGLAAKFLDTVSYDGSILNYALAWLGNVFSRIGVWVLLAELIALYSKSPGRAALYVFLFFAGMLLAYYFYTTKLFGFFPRYYFLHWGMIALASPALAWFAWFGRGEGWFSVLAAALPAGLLLQQGLSFGFWYLYPSYPTELICAVAVLAVTCRGWKRLGITAGAAAAAAFLLQNTRVLSYLIGGL
ncbi:hypothetical protein [Anaerolentibacter hominis]|uniref:hypothetical protein n=1 Tax=Anaerolentibacter hominis TaxID=3079009 RepID=UPI0031B88E2B